MLLGMLTVGNITYRLGQNARDAGTRYRAVMLSSNVAQLGVAEASAHRCQAELDRAGTIR